MKTKVTVLGQEVAATELKRIEFVYCVGETLLLSPPANASDWGNIVLIKRNFYENSLDVMYAYSDGDADGGYLYLGHFNDGIV